MPRRLKLDGDDWEIGVDRYDPHPGVRAVVFHCVSNPQRPYRVAEIPAARAAAEDVERWPADELRELFEDSDPMDVPHVADGDAFHPRARPLAMPDYLT